jgi:hypothetical protein
MLLVFVFVREAWRKAGENPKSCEQLSRIDRALAKSIGL